MHHFQDKYGYGSGTRFNTHLGFRGDKKAGIWPYISRPTQSLLQKWLREIHGINVYVAYCEYSIKSENTWSFTLDNPTKLQNWQESFNSYEEALGKGLQEALKLI